MPHLNPQSFLRSQGITSTGCSDLGIDCIFDVVGTCGDLSIAKAKFRVKISIIRLKLRQFQCPPRGRMILREKWSVDQGANNLRIGDLSLIGQSKSQPWSTENATACPFVLGCFEKLGQLSTLKPWRSDPYCICKLAGWLAQLSTVNDNIFSTWLV